MRRRTALTLLILQGLLAAPYYLGLVATLFIGLAFMPGLPSLSITTLAVVVFYTIPALLFSIGFYFYYRGRYGLSSAVSLIPILYLAIEIIIPRIGLAGVVHLPVFF